VIIINVDDNMNFMHNRNPNTNQSPQINDPSVLCDSFTVNPQPCLLQCTDGFNIDVGGKNALVSTQSKMFENQSDLANLEVDALKYCHLSNYRSFYNDRELQLPLNLAASQSELRPYTYLSFPEGLRPQLSTTRTDNQHLDRVLQDQYYSFTAPRTLNNLYNLYENSELKLEDQDSVKRSCNSFLTVDNMDSWLTTKEFSKAITPNGSQQTVTHNNSQVTLDQGLTLKQLSGIQDPSKPNQINENFSLISENELIVDPKFQPFIKSYNLGNYSLSSFMKESPKFQVPTSTPSFLTPGSSKYRINSTPDNTFDNIQINSINDVANFDNTSTVYNSNHIFNNNNGASSINPTPSKPTFIISSSQAPANLKDKSQKKGVHENSYKSLPQKNKYKSSVDEKKTSYPGRPKRGKLRVLELEKKNALLRYENEKLRKKLSGMDMLYETQS
jgi:hypothetical protein